jgi:tetratricopeptide (TPR) repeat protein
MLKAVAFDETIRTAPADRATSVLWLERGLAELLAGESLRAAHSFRAAIDADFDNLVAHHGHVLALRLAGRLRAALRGALALSILAPKDPLVHAVLALSLQAAEMYEPAQKAEARAHALLAERQQQLAAEVRQSRALFPILGNEAFG